MASPEEMAASMIANLREKTGKSLPQWLKVTAKCGFSKHGEIVKFLKSEHGMTHGFANLVAHKTLNSSVFTKGSDSDFVATQYSGAKADMKPIYDAVIKAVKKFGKDVEVSPKKAYVSLRRSKQFAIVQPSTKTRVDIGINLKGEKATKRLEDSGSFSSMVTHRVRVEAVDRVNKQLLGWMKAAYDAS
jgi:predicted transport protein